MEALNGTGRVCSGCGDPLPAYTRLRLCLGCTRVVQACRGAVAALIRSNYVEQIGPSAFVFKQGAQELANLIAEDDDFLMLTHDDAATQTARRIQRTPENPKVQAGWAKARERTEAS